MNHNNGGSFKEIIYFFRENEDITPFLYENFKNRGDLIRTISRNQFNNRIGYYQFNISKDEYCKIYVFPKTVNPNQFESNLEGKNEFLIYFQEYLRLRKVFPGRHGDKSIHDNISDIDLVKPNNVNQYFLNKYSACLKEIIKFFKRHRKDKRKIVSFSSQSVSDKLNIKANVQEINKSKIHQDRSIKTNYSKVAEISLNVLKYFSSHKSQFLSVNDDSKDILVHSNELNKLLRKNFDGLSGNFSQYKVKKSLEDSVFNKSDSLRVLRRNLIILLGWEVHENRIKINDFDSIWFSPEYMYELSLRERLERLSKDLDFQLSIKDPLNYELMEGNEVLAQYRSEPDFVVRKDEVCFVIDAKWKTLMSLGGIDSSDVLKAYRDAVIHGSDHKKTVILLVYPKIRKGEVDFLGKQLAFSYDRGIQFYLIESPIFGDDRSFMGFFENNWL